MQASLQTRNHLSINIIKYFCEKAGFEDKQIDVLNDKIINANSDKFVSIMTGTNSPSLI